MNKILLYICLCFPMFLMGQEEKNDSTETGQIVEVFPANDSAAVNYLSFRNPMRASLYSAVLPGMGQIYNKKWWKAPLVWGILGTGTGFIIYYNNQYKEYRGYYLDKLYGNPIAAPGIANLSKEQLATIQDDRKRSRDYAIALTALGYLLNILDATVDAHLYGINKDPDLSFQPVMMQDFHSSEIRIGLGVNYQF
ncbi:MAG: DUF5683 domain-containing protein [Moheibacter sp.]